MKTRFKNNSEVAHIWASQTQHEGRGSNLFFEGTKIYSYGRHFCVANFAKPNVVLFNSNSYSVSTSKHQTYVRRAIPGNVQVFGVVEPDLSYHTHEKNLRAYLEFIKDQVGRAQRSHKQTEAFIESARRNQLIAIEYATVFELPLTGPVISEIVAYELPNLSARIASQAAKAQQAKEKKLAAQGVYYEELRKFVPQWLKGEGIQTAVYHLPEVYLREKDLFVETSKGARVMLHEAKQLYNMIEAGKDIVGHRIGSYTVISLNGVLTIGCHKIEREEIKRFASVMGW